MHRSYRTLTVAGIALIALLQVSSETLAENWPAWRGPRGDGTSQEQEVPVRWGPDENIRWKVPVRAAGHASPIIWEDRIFLVGCDEQREARTLTCRARDDGGVIWHVDVLEAPLEGKHPLNSYASGTPVTDGQRVFVSFLDRDEMFVAAYTFDGDQLWRARPGGFSSKHGYCSSPVLYEDLVIVNGDHDGEAYLVALDQESGSVRWQTIRPNRIRSYSTPIIRNIDGRTQMILSGSQSVASYDPRDGSQHWVIDGPTDQFVASIIYNGELLFMTCGFPDRHMLAIRPDGRGNVTDTHVVWRTTRAASYVPSPIAAGDYFLVAADNGLASCFDAETGQRHWIERIGRRYSASLVSAAGLVYFLSDDGVTTVVRAGEEFDAVAENELGEATYASAAISQGQLFIRGEEHLYCIGD